jgi:hypothetical protein
MGTRTLFSRRGSHPRLQAINLPASLTHSTQKDTTPPPQPHETYNSSMPNMALISTVSSGAGGTSSCNSRSCCSRLMVVSTLSSSCVLHLNGVLEVQDRVGTSVHLLTCKVELLMGEVSPMLGLTKAAVHGLQLQVYLHRLMCPTTEDGVLTLKPPYRVRCTRSDAHAAG